MSYECVACVKNEVFIYRIPVRQSNRGYKAADWNLDSPDWTGRMRLISKGNDLVLKLEDRNTGELFASCPIPEYPGIAVESVLDSSRYFIIRLESDNSKHAFVGMGFADRSDSFDMNVAIQDHFKKIKQEEEAAIITERLGQEPSLNLGFKEGETIRINLKTNMSHSNENIRGQRKNVGQDGGSVGILPPPPPGGARKQQVSSLNKVGGNASAAGSTPPHSTNNDLINF